MTLPEFGHTYKLNVGFDVTRRKKQLAENRAVIEERKAAAATAAAAARRQEAKDSAQRRRPAGAESKRDGEGAAAAAAKPPVRVYYCTKAFVLVHDRPYQIDFKPQCCLTLFPQSSADMCPAIKVAPCKLIACQPVRITHL